MEDFVAPESHVEEEKKAAVKSLVAIEKKRKLKLKDELSREQKFTKSILGASTSRGGLSSLREFKELLERDIQRSELEKAGLTNEEQDLYFKFREDTSLPDRQSFRDRLTVINEKIEDFFKVEKEVKLQHPIDDLAEMEKVLFDDLADIPSLRKRRKMMIKEEKRLLSTPISSGSTPTPGRSSKSKWDQR